MPELISRFVSGLPDAEFLTRMSKVVDSERWDILSLNLAGGLDKPLAVQTFDHALGEMLC